MFMKAEKKSNKLVQSFLLAVMMVFIISVLVTGCGLKDDKPSDDSESRGQVILNGKSNTSTTDASDSEDDQEPVIKDDGIANDNDDDINYDDYEDGAAAYSWAVWDDGRLAGIEAKEKGINLDKF